MNRHTVSTERAKEFGVSVEQKDGEKTLSPNDIGKILGVTGEAVKQWIYHRRLPAIKLGNGYWKVKVADFERFLAARHSRKFPIFVECSEEYKKAIETAGYDVITANNRFDAMLKLKEFCPMMLVLDATSKAIPGVSTARTAAEDKTD